MKNSMTIAVLIGAAGLAAPAVAQDSVARDPGVANTDAVGAFDTDEQRNNFVVDLAPIESSWGNTFGIAPVLKSTRVSTLFPSNLISAQGLSAKAVVGAFASPTYDLWFGPGFGVNADFNNPGVPLPVASLPGAATTRRLGAVFSDFGTTDNNRSYNGVIGGLINYLPADNTRLFVSWINAAVNGANGNENRSQIGVGSVDASGNVYFRADGFGTTGPNSITGNNVFRIDLLDRNTGAVNVIDNSGGSDAGATDWIVQRSGTTYNIPSNVPEECSTRPVYIGTNFATQYAYESAPLSISTTTAHRPGTTDHRGNANFSASRFFGGDSVGTAALLTKPSEFGGATRGISVWGTGADGAVTTARTLSLPPSVTDNADGTVITADQEFDHYHGQVGFRGGPQVGLGEDRDGSLLAAAWAPVGGADLNWPLGILAVARLSGPDAIPEWTTAAYVVDDGGDLIGKTIVDQNGARVGSLRPLFEVTGGDPLGPSMSAPAIDAAGNIWFLSAYVNEDENGTPLGSPTTGLFRAVYDGTDFSYTVERILSNGQEIRGATSDRTYKIIFLSIADNDSVSSSTLWANNINQETYGGAGLETLENSDAATLGGLVIQASVIYDVNDDGEFESLTGGMGIPNSPDQNYSVALFIGGADFTQTFTDCNENGSRDLDDILLGRSQDANGDGVPDECDGEGCIADFDNSGAVDSNDYFAFLTAFFNGDPSADVDGAPGINSNDYFFFLTAFFEGCP